MRNKQVINLTSTLHLLVSLLLTNLDKMASDLPVANGNGHVSQDMSQNQQAVKEGLARMLKGGVIMDVVNAEQVSFQFLESSRHRSI